MKLCSCGHPRSRHQMATSWAPHQMNARYATTCPACGLNIEPGQPIEFSSGRKAVHQACAPAPPTDEPDALLRRLQELGYNAAGCACERWQPNGSDDLGKLHPEMALTEVLRAINSSGHPRPEALILAVNRWYVMADELAILVELWMQNRRGTWEFDEAVRKLVKSFGLSREEKKD